MNAVLYWIAVDIGTSGAMLLDPPVWIALFVALCIGLSHRSWLWLLLVSVVSRLVVLAGAYSWQEQIGVTNAERLENFILTNICFMVMASAVWSVGWLLRSAVTRPGNRLPSQ